MQEVQYPTLATIQAFGGLSETARALNLNKQTVDRWKSAKGGLIPRWWSNRIQLAAKSRKVRLPKPQEVQ